MSRSELQAAGNAATVTCNESTRTYPSDVMPDGIWIELYSLTLQISISVKRTDWHKSSILYCIYSRSDMDLVYRRKVVNVGCWVSRHCTYTYIVMQCVNHLHMYCTCNTNWRMVTYVCVTLFWPMHDHKMHDHKMHDSADAGCKLTYVRNVHQTWNVKASRLSLWHSQALFIAVAVQNDYSVQVF